MARDPDAHENWFGEYATIEDATVRLGHDAGGYPSVVVSYTDDEGERKVLSSDMDTFGWLRSVLRENGEEMPDELPQPPLNGRESLFSGYSAVEADD